MDQPGDDVGLDREHVGGGPGADVLRHADPLEQWHARLEGARRDVLGQLGAHGGGRYQSCGGDPLLRLTANVGVVPCRPAGTEPSQDSLDRRVAAERPWPRRVDNDRETRLGRWVAVAERAQFVVPPLHQLGAVLRDDLVGPGFLPGPTVPRLVELRPGFLVGIVGSPLCFVAVGVAADLGRPRAEPAGVRLQLADLAGPWVEGEPRRGDGGTEFGVGHHRRMPDSVQRFDAVAESNRVQATPLVLGEDARVDLEVQVPVRVAGTRGVVADGDGLDPLDRDLDLPAAWSHPGGVACSATQPMICSAARSCASSYAAAISGCKEAASDQVFGPFTVISTNRTAFGSARSRPRGAPVAGSQPATQLS